MKVISKPTNIVKCPTCGAVLQYEKDEVRTKTEYDVRNDAYDVGVITCPICEKEIKV